MTAKTSIEWTDKSSNPLRAYHRETGKRGWFCVHKSSGCINCYAERRNRWIGNGLHYTAQNLKHVRFEMDEKELRSWAKLAPGTKVFAFDMTDLFQEAVPDELIDQAFQAMGFSPATFQILTKRPGRMREFVRESRRSTTTASAWRFAGDFPLPNVWLGVSVEDQATADERIPLLLQTPAAKRFVSYEPALGPICCAFRGIDWLIYGGESGPRARGNDLAWARSAAEQCRAAGTAFFMKQAGASPYEMQRVEGTNDLAVSIYLKDSKGGDPAEWPEDLRVREFPS